MTFDAENLIQIGELNDADFDLFKTAVRTLLSRTFIVRGIKRSDQVYNFAVRNIQLLEAWFGCADMELRRDETLGVVACRAGHDMRLRLNRDETCALLVFRLMFEEKRIELSITGYPSISVFEFAQRYRAVVGDDLKKTRLETILRKLAGCRLVDIPSDPTNPDGIIVLYPSLAMVLDQKGIDEISAAVSQEDLPGEDLE